MCQALPKPFFTGFSHFLHIYKLGNLFLSVFGVAEAIFDTLIAG